MQIEDPAGSINTFSERGPKPPFTPRAAVQPERGQDTKGPVRRSSHHEYFVRHLGICSERETNCRMEAGAGVVLRVPQYDHSGGVELPALLQARADKSCSDTLMLLRWQGGHWCQRHQEHRSVIRHCLARTECAR
jgi:hypothetical protein